MMERKTWIRVFALVLAAMATTSAHAAYPDKPVTLVVPFAPGGGTDIIARLFGERLSAALKQPVIVDNKPGAGATLGAAYVAKAPADGYTLLMGTSAELTIGPNLQPVRYDPVKDFVPVALVGWSANVVLAYPGFGPTTMSELIAYAKAHPDRVAYGTGGVGTSPHLAGEMLAAMAGIRLTHVPYKGSGPAMNDVMSGQTQLMISTLAPALPLFKEHKVKALAVTSATRLPQLQETPTVAEQGLTGYEAITWYAVMAPAGTPPDVLARLRQAINSVVQSREVIDRLQSLGIEAPADPSQAEALQARIAAELGLWARVIRTNGIRPE